MKSSARTREERLLETAALGLRTLAALHAFGVEANSGKSTKGGFAVTTVGQAFADVYMEFTCYADTVPPREFGTIQMSVLWRRDEGAWVLSLLAERHLLPGAHPGEGWTLDAEVPIDDVGVTVTVT